MGRGNFLDVGKLRVLWEFRGFVRGDVIIGEFLRFD